MREHREALRWNFDAEFLGINSEDVEILRQLDDASLEEINIEPVRPSVLKLSRKIQTNVSLSVQLNFELTLVRMAGLRKLEIEFDADHPQPEVEPDQVFLSKLTGILAFKKMKRNGVEIHFVINDAQAAHRKCGCADN